MIEDLLLIGLFTSGEDAIPILQEDPFHMKKNGTIEQECYIEYQRDHAGIPILYLNELNLEDGSVIWHNELPASLLIDPDIRFVRRS